MDFNIFEQTEQLKAEDELPIIIDVPQDVPEDIRKQIKHSVVFPPHSDIKCDPPDFSQPIFRLDPPKVFAKTYPFALDPFYLKSIAALERAESVLVSAHTSAGKTAIAEYAIALALRKNYKVAYTSPIKALSNQKFRDLSLVYHNYVGLMTGDSTVNRQAYIVVMTTEILRNMLYQGAEMLRELGCVIFDEVHYMRNAERGVVWEDCIAQIDSRAIFVFLSATIPNATEFAGWVSRIHQKPMHVIYTEYRPVPLQFCICPVGAKEVFYVFTSDSREVNVLNVEKARRSLPFYGGRQGGMSGKTKMKLVNETILDCLAMLQAKQILPVIVFSFGKARCEELAQLALHQGKIGTLLTKQQVETVDLIFNAALGELDEADRGMKYIAASRSLLRQGIAVHHSGLLPFIKEITEILFYEDLVKIIFVTETFAMGLNLPARCVVFTDMQKYDGQNNRYLQSGEYIQMAGRSGRRGKDTQGLVISFFSSYEDCTETLQIMQGGAEALNSVYRIGYCQLLNYLRVEGISAQEAIMRSFLQFQRDFRLPRCENAMQDIDIELLRLEREFTQTCDAPLEELLEYMDTESVLFSERYQMMELYKEQDFREAFAAAFKCGRIIEICGDDYYFGYGVALQCERRGRELALDCLIPGIAPSQYNTRQKSNAPAIVLAQNKAQEFTAAGEFVYQILRDNAYSSFLTRPAQAENLDAALDAPHASESANALECAYISNAYHVCFDEAAQRDRMATSVVRNDVFRYILNKLGFAGASRLFNAQALEPILIRVPLSCVRSVRALYIKHIPVSYTAYDDRYDILRRFLATCLEMWNRKAYGKPMDAFVTRDDILPRLPYDQLPNIQLKYVQYYARIEKLLELLKTRFPHAHAFFNGFDTEKISSVAAILKQILEHRRRKFLLQTELQKGAGVLSHDLQQKQALLSELAYFDFQQRKVLEKGKIAAGINAVNELVITEALFAGVFASQPAPVICGLIGALLGERIRQTEYELDSALAAPVQRLKGVIGMLLDKCSIFGVELDQAMTKVEDVIDLYNGQASFLWASGATLYEVLDQIPELFEGNLVRNFRRLVTALEQISEATAGWADGAMAKVCIDAAVLVNRGLVKADSLYIVEKASE